MKKMASRAALAVAGISSAIFAANPAQAENSRYDFQPPVTTVAEQILNLHHLMLIICTVIFVVVFAFMFWSIFAHRKSKGVKPAHFHENTLVEILWTVIPVLILVAMAWPATKTIIAMKDTSAPDITIKAVGYQWKWGYEYLQGEGEGVNFYSTLSTPPAQITRGEWKGPNYLLEVDNPVVVPVGKKIRLLLTAQDVIHAWWVPALGVKQDAFPGFVRDAWFRADKEGVFRGNCAELCGKDHAFMPIVVNVVSESEYAAWVAEQKQAKAPAAAAAAAPITSNTAG